MILSPLPLKLEIQNRIRAAGPMPVSQYMELCLTHPRYGYYATLDPFGAGGDFTTSPEISQMFGELIGLWSASVWTAMGEPSSINIVELGPGRGTMMADFIRAAKILPAFRQAINIHLVETSRTLRERQKERLADADRPIFWHAMLQDVPRAPAIYLANEFFDAMPVTQMVRAPDGWHERMIDINEYGDFKFDLSREPVRSFAQTIPRNLRDAPVGSIFEWRSPVVALELGRRVRSGGAALIIDYGHVRSAIGDTLQAVRRHRFDDPLTGPGLSDLSAHVDFEALTMSATSLGARAHGAVDQGSFLVTLGIDKRAAALRVDASPEVAAAVGVALERLIAPNQTGMGAMFKVLGLSDPSITILPGLDSRSATRAA
jgi:NADH dehydrogenase [ubiquinone] 1 alpha subcomplex assembly factor 7